MRNSAAAKLVIVILLLVGSNSLWAQSFGELCQKGPDGFPVDPRIVNCWGFDDGEKLNYGDYDESACTPADVEYLESHNTGEKNSILNADINTDASKGVCLYPVIDSDLSASGDNSLRITQSDKTGSKKGGGSFRPYIQSYRDSGGKERFVTFGQGGEFWVYWKYRQDDELFNYWAKRFMVTHNSSYFEEVLCVRGEGSKATPPANQPFAYNHKGSGKLSQNHGRAEAKRLEADRWHTVVYHIKMATNMDDRTDHRFDPIPDGQPDLNNGTLEVFIDGELVFSRYPQYGPDGIITDGLKMEALSFTEPVYGPGGQLLRGVPGYDPDKGTMEVAYSDKVPYEDERRFFELNGYFRLDFLLYENGKEYNPDVSSHRPDGHMWVDDVIVSTEYLPYFALSVDTTPPSAPTGLSVSQ